MRSQFPREFYIPQSAQMITDDKSDAVIYVTKNSKGRPQALGFCGKRKKPDFNYNFKTADSLAAYVGDYVKGRRATLARKAEEKIKQAEKRAKGHSFKVGDILYSSWGYDQTNVDFYQVVALKGKTMVTLREISSRQVKATGGMSNTVEAVKDSFTGDEFSRRVDVRYGQSVNIDRCSRASAWDGKPKHSSWYH